MTKEEFFKTRDYIYNYLVKMEIIEDKDTNYKKIDFVLGDILNVDWEELKINA
jgi:hypothetical protein